VLTKSENRPYICGLVF